MRAYEKLDAVIRLVLIIVIFALPWLFVPVAGVTLTQGKMLFVSCVLVLATLVWMIARWKERGVHVASTSIYLASFLLACAYAASAALAGFSSISLIGSGIDVDTLAFIITCTILLALTANVFSGHPSGVALALRALLVGGLVLLVFEGMHFIVPSLALGGALLGQTGNLFGEWQEFADIAALLFFFSITFLKTPVTRGLWRYGAILLALFSWLILFVANYRVVWISLAAALALYLFARGYRAGELRSMSFWRKEWFAGVLIALSLSSAYFGPLVTPHLPNTMRVSQTDVRPSLQGTYAVGQSSLSKPVPFFFGTGPNTFVRQWGLHKPVGVNGTPFWNTDFPTGVASIATAFITVGFLGLLAWLALIGALLWTIFRFWSSSIVTSGAGIALPLSVGVLYLLSLQLFSVPGPMLSLLLYICAGLLVALLVPSHIRERHIAFAMTPVPSLLAMLATLCLVLALLTTSFASARVVLAESLVNRAIVTYNKTSDIRRASAYVNSALRIYPNDDGAHRAAVQLGFLRLQELATSGASGDAARAQLQATLQETIKHGLDAVSINGADYQNWLLLASLYRQLADSNVEGAYENARAAFEKAVAENPASPIPYLDLAQLEMLQKNNAVALVNLSKAVTLKPDFAAAYHMGSQIYASDNDLDHALKMAVLAAQYAPNDSSAWYNLGVIAHSAKDYGAAVAALKQALTLQPQYANALYILGLAEYRLNDTGASLAAFQALDALDPGHDMVKTIIKKLSAGESLAPEASGEPAESTKPLPAKKR